MCYAGDTNYLWTDLYFFSYQVSFNLPYSFAFYYCSHYVHMIIKSSLFFCKKAVFMRSIKTSSHVTPMICTTRIYIIEAKFEETWGTKRFSLFSFIGFLLFVRKRKINLFWSPRFLKLVSYYKHTYIYIQFSLLHVLRFS